MTRSGATAGWPLVLLLAGVTSCGARSDDDDDDAADGDADSDGDGDGDGDVCTKGYAPFPTFDKSCEGDVDCVAGGHQRDCCGSLDFIGMNQAAFESFEAAEEQCRARNPAVCDCKPSHRAEDGEQVLGEQGLAIQCEDGACVAFAAND